jgi:farnesyl-diphosphate farnesyltransferase
MPSLRTLFRLDEVVAMIQVKTQFANIKVQLTEEQADLKFCYDILVHVSRSFATVIIQLSDELRDAVCLFYLVLRALDTIEDDMSVPVATKKDVLPKFHEKLYDPEWSIDGIGIGKERELLEKYPCVTREFLKLKPEYRDVISDITVKMANGMCHFLETEVVTTKDYELYCHYVAGLVGHGLTRLFAVSGLEAPDLADDLYIANEMGLFLQKTNIIRDYLEDIVEEPPRIFWPKDIWGQFTDDLHLFKDPAHIDRAVQCLNALVADALQHVPACIEYMEKLKSPTVILFCAIPQVMAIATLNTLYGNKDVFTGKVKIRKGEACKIIVNSYSMQNVLTTFKMFAKQLEAKLDPEDASYDRAMMHLKAGYARIDIAATKHGVSIEPSVARNFLTHYPALGGQLIYNIVDNTRRMFTGE